MTVERAELAEFWPFVDVGKLRLNPDDVLIVCVLNDAIFEDRVRFQHLVQVCERAFPGVRCLYARKGELDFIVKRAMPEMRAEDLVQPERRGTME